MNVVSRRWTALNRSARDLVCGALFDWGLTRPGRSAADRLTIATLHRVLPDEALRQYPLPQLAVTVDEIVWLIAFFQEHFTCGTLSASCLRWMEGDRPARPLLALTFDDGQLDNYLHARPCLERAGVRATFFIPVDAVDANRSLWHDRLVFGALRLLSEDRPAALRILREVGGGDTGVSDRDLARAAVARAKALPEAARLALVDRVEQAAGGSSRPAWDGSMSWAQLRALAADGHEIGSHSMSHPLLTRVDGAQLDREVAGSKARIEAELGARCDTFCYPNGDCDERVVDAVHRAGYRFGVVTAWGPNARRADPLRLTRCDLQGQTSRDRQGRLSAPRVALRVSPLFARLHR